MHRQSWAVVILIASVATMAASAPDAGKSPYERLDNTKFADALSAGGMVGLLGALADELQTVSPNDASYARAQMYILQARSPAAQQDAKTRAELLKKADDLLKPVVEASAKSSDGRQLIKNFRYRLLLDDLRAIVTVQPYFERMLYLQSSDEDRKIILDSTERAVKDLSILHDRINDALKDWRTPDNATLMVTLGADLEELELVTSYKLAYASLCRGLALGDGQADKPAKTKLLNAARTAVEPIAKQSDNDNNMKYWATLISAQASGGLKDYQKAMDILKVATSDQAEPPVRIAGMFELCRVLIEKGDFPAAQKQLENFGKQAGEILGPAGKVPTEVQYSLLSNYLYDRWAESIRATDPKKADEYAAQAQNALLKFAADHPELQYAFFELIANRYRTIDPKDYKTLNPMIQTAVAIRERGKKTPANDAVAEQLLQNVRNSSDPEAASVKPLAMMNLAELYVSRGDNLGAYAILMEIAEKFPDSPLAYQSILNAARVIDAVIQDRIEKNQLVAANLRQALIKSLDKLFARKEWTDRPEVQGWYFAQAWQYNKLADTVTGLERAGYLEKALAVYDKVPSGLPETMEARYLAAKCRADLLAATGNTKTAGDVIKSLNDFSAAAAMAAKTAKPDVARQLREWGADAALTAADTLYNHTDNKAAGQAAYEDVLKNWPDTHAVENTSAKLIIVAFSNRKTAADTQKAQERLNDYKTKYPQNAPALIAKVIQSFKDSINTQRYDSSKAAQLAVNRNGYYDCARFLYDSIKEKSQGKPAEMYPYEQMLADATLESGMAASDPKSQAQQYDTALKLFQKCKAYDDAIRANQTMQVEAMLAPKIKAVQDAAGNGPKLVALADTFLTKDLADNNINARNFSPAMTVRNNLALVKKQLNDPAPEAMAALQLSLTRGYASLGKTLARSIDAVNLWGLARSYKALKQYDKALPILKQIVDGTDKSDANYWPAELEYCDCCLEGYHGDGKIMAGLISRIQQLKNDGGQMGGLLPYFNGIAAQAERSSKPR